jgi:hypothetical protein
VQDKPLRIEPRSQDFRGIAAHGSRRRDLRQKPAIRPSESKIAVRLSIELVTLFVDSAVVSPTEQGEIRECGGTPLCPVTDVMSLAEPHPAARKAAAAVSMVERAP